MATGCGVERAGNMVGFSVNSRTTSPVTRRTRAAALFLAVALAAMPTAAVEAGESADKAAEAERLLYSGRSADALTAFDAAAEAFWTASPLQARVALFAATVEGLGSYAPRPDPVFKPGDTLLVYFEPFGFAFTPMDGGFRSALVVDVQIRSPGGILYAEAKDFGRLEWSGRTRLHEVHATVGLPLPPQLKAGAYELLLTLRDTGSPKTATLTFPFTIAG